MKKITFIAAICLAFAATLNAQEITPNQLKAARMAVYEWVDNYRVKIPYEKAGRFEQQIQDFVGLFADEHTLIYNDLYARANYDFASTDISVIEYAQQAQDENSFFQYQLEIDSVELRSEFYHNDSLFYIVRFNKILSANERGNWKNTRYIYPERTIQYEVKLRCDLSEKPSIKALSLQPTSSISPFLVFYNGLDSYYTTEEEMEKRNIENSTPYISVSTCRLLPSDEKIVSIIKDTIKQNIHFSPYVGGSFYSLNMLNDSLHDIQLRPTVSEGFSVGYYHQYKLTKKHRLGMEINASYLYRNFNLSGTYSTRYNAVDSVGGPYVRHIELNNYRENISSHALYLSYIPIRHDIICHSARNYWSFYWSLGFFASYTFTQTANVTADGKYSGYYWWLFDVVMDQKGIYDFGEHQIDSQSHQTALRKFNAGITAAMGFQFFIPKSHWSIEPSVRFQSTIYMPITKENKFHIIDSAGNWKSATYMFNRIFMQNVGFQLNLNYNFK